MKEYSISKIVNAIIGSIDPVGETYEDDRRYENLETTSELVDSITDQLIYISRFRNRPEASIKRAGNMAHCILQDLQEKLNDNLTT